MLPSYRKELEEARMVFANAIVKEPRETLMLILYMMRRTSRSALSIFYGNLDSLDHGIEYLRSLGI